MKEHTALPWTYKYGEVYSPDGQIVAVRWSNADIAPWEKDANLAYIAKACNSFPALVSALAEITDRFERLERLYFEATQQEPDGENGSVVRARAALKEVKGA